MNTRSLRWLTTALAVAALLTVAGCATGFVTDAARNSLASFMVNVLSTAVNETVGG